MRLGLLGPAEGDVDGLGRAAETLVGALKVDRAIYLGNDTALDQVVAAWAQRLVDGDPSDDAVWSRAARLALAGSPGEIDSFVRKERARQRLRILEGLGTTSEARTVEMIGDRVAVLLYDKASLDEEDIFAAAILIYGKSPEPLVKKVGNRWFLTPGSIGAPGGGLAVLDDGSEEIVASIHAPDGSMTITETLVIPRATKMKIQGGGVNVAIYGGSFNPPHVAHVLAVAFVLATEDVDRVVVIPTYRHPFAKTLAPYDDRVEMCALSMGWMPRVEVSRVEEELGGESRTLRTLEHLQEAHPDWSMRLLMGADLLLEAPRWFRFDAISAIAKPLVVGRAGVDTEGAPPAILPAISSTDVRAKIAAGEWAELGHLVPRDVLALIRERRLYLA